MRLFVGIDLPAEAKEELYQLALELKRSSRSGRFVPPENMHLTLAFIGETRRINDADEALEHVAASFRTRVEGGFELEFSGVGSFKQQRGHTWWIGIGEGPGRVQLLSLQAEVVQALRSADFDIEKRSYKPHFTLARAVKTEGLVRLAPPMLTIPVEEFCLFSSRSVDGKQEYTIEQRYPLGRG